MTDQACPVDEVELGALLDGELTENRAHRLREHLAACAACAARLARLQALVTRLRAPVPEAHGHDFVDEVERRLPAGPAAAGPAAASARRGPARRAALLLGGLGGLGLAAAAAAALFVRPRPRPWPQPQTVPGDLTPRGARARWFDRVSVTLTVVEGGPERPSLRPLVPGARLRPGDGLAVQAQNANSWPVHLMVFGIDARNDVHWIQPLWRDPAQNPRSVVLPPDGPSVPAQGAAPDRPAPGPFRVVSLLSRAALDVRSIEALVASGRPLATGEDRHVREIAAEIVAP
jgi:hypothetical protein